MLGDMQMSGSTLAALSLWGAFLLGLTGGFGHCLVMCGPFVAAASLSDGAASSANGPAEATSSVKRSGVFQLAYHAGRLATYTLLGGLLGLLGEAGAILSLGGPFTPVEITRWLKVSAGVLMLAMGALLFVAWVRGHRANLPEPTAWLASLPWFGRAVARLSRSGGWWGLPLGALMGLLPCAPLLPVELAALATGRPLFGAATMLAFGLGTVPALAGFGAATGLLGARARGWFAPAAAAAILALGLITLAQGLQTAGAL